VDRSHGQRHQWRSGQQDGAFLSAVASLRQAVQQSTSSADLQQRIAALQGPTLGPAEQTLPLSQLKTQLTVALPNADPLSLLGLGLRNGLACLALAIGFAALGRRRRAPEALLMEWQNGLNQLRFRRRSSDHNR
jgi:hypothetical protein